MPPPKPPAPKPPPAPLPSSGRTGAPPAEPRATPPPRRAEPPAASPTLDTFPPPPLVARDPAPSATERILDAAAPGGLSAAARAGLRERAAQPSYLKMAFANPYNLSLLAGGLIASAVTLNPLPAAVALGAEALWLLHGPDSKLLRRLLWDPRLQADQQAREAADRELRLQALAPAARNRIDILSERRTQIGRLAAQNPSFTGELLRSELVKADLLVEAFIDLSSTCGRYESYVASIDDQVLERDARRYEAAVRSGAPDDPRTVLSRKNLAIVRKRQERVNEIRRQLGVARGQLDLIENSFQLIADQIVTMQSPHELSGQLDELLGGVEAIRETARETEALLGDKEP